MSDLLSLRGVVLTRTSLQVSAKVSPGEWKSIGTNLHKIKGSIQWWIGDWLLQGEKVYGDSHPAYTEALASTEYEKTTLINMKSVADAIPSSRRRELVSWNHHEAVVIVKDPTEQDRLLKWAQDNRVSLSDFRSHIRGTKPSPTPESQIASLREWIHQNCPHLRVLVKGSIYGVQARTADNDEDAFDVELRSVTAEQVKTACMEAESRGTTRTRN